MGFFKKMFTTDPLKPVEKIADQVEALEEEYKGYTDAQLRAKTEEFKERLKNGETVDDILPEAFATVREASFRTTGMRHYRVQIIGGIVLHQGNIAEMLTGEGKTLVATLPAYLNALTGESVHIVTVNDYLAKRDSEWMGKIYKFLGMSVGLIIQAVKSKDRREQYARDIVYGTNNEFGFDYLRDNMVIYKENMVQRDLSYAIVDEVDSILIDEARTPLIISGKGDKSTEMYNIADRFVSKLKEESDYTVDEKMKTVSLTDIGVEKAETFFKLENLSDPENTEINHHINQALKAHVLYLRDRDYVVQDGQVVIVDEFTGRLMIGRRYSEGLHQAIEAKENVKVERESKTLATITFQNYFRMYKKLAGMTGTAKTEEEEFRGIYNLDVVTIPTHKKMIREDMNDVIYSTEKGKFNAVIGEILKYHDMGQPVLVGTVSVEKSERVSKMLSAKGIPHNVLNAKNHKKEAEIIAQAGKVDAVTIATNMAGRGTDILLGGNPDFMARQEMARLGYTDEQIEDAVSHAETEDEEILAARKKYQELYDKHKVVCDAEHERVVEAGGLHIIGTERHESRRIDNQLRGRAGRQGDPGSSQFFVALEDDLMRLFGTERVQGMIDRLNPNDDIPMEVGMLTKQIEIAQKRIEGRNYDIRKHVLQYDDVMNQQREVIYEQRRRVLMGEDVKGSILEMVDTMADYIVSVYCPEGTYQEDWDFAAMEEYLQRITGKGDIALLKEGENREAVERKELKERIVRTIDDLYREKEEEIAQKGGDMREVERIILLRNVDRYWMDHIDGMDQLRQGITLRAYGHRDPVVEYRFEGFEMFEEMIRNIQEDTISQLLHVSVEVRMEREEVAKESAAQGASEPGATKEPAKAEKKVGRNDPCPCGSGKKYKNCCGK